MSADAWMYKYWHPTLEKQMLYLKNHSRFDPLIPKN